MRDVLPRLAASTLAADPPFVFAVWTYDSREQAAAVVALVAEAHADPAAQLAQLARAAIARRTGNLAIAAGVAGSVMAITGLASVIRGTMLRGRLRLVPDVGADREALVLTGRFR